MAGFWIRACIMVILLVVSVLALSRRPSPRPGFVRHHHDEGN
jgi:hypothetical protein